MNGDLLRGGRAHPYLTRQEAAKYLGLAINTLAHHPKKFPAIRFVVVCST
jgi:hypothetical protein